MKKPVGNRRAHDRKHGFVCIKKKCGGVRFKTNTNGTFTCRKCRTNQKVEA